MGLPATPLKASANYFLRNQKEGTKVPLRDGFIIGRVTGDLVLPNFPNLSSRHCRFQIADEKVIVFDLNSTNGVFVNGQRLEKGSSREVPAGDTVEVGDIVFYLEREEKAENQEPLQVATSAAPSLGASLQAKPIAPGIAQLEPAKIGKPKLVGGAAPKPAPVPAAAPAPAPAPAIKVDGSPFVCYFFAVLNIVAFIWAVRIMGQPLFGADAEKLVAVGGSINVLTTHGQWWRLLTATFAHADVTHISSNLIVLVFMGVPVARAMGDLRFGLVYLGAGLFGSLTSVTFSSPVIVTVGASGAIFGIVGALGVLQLLGRIEIGRLGKFGVLSTAQFTLRNIGLGVQGVDAFAHLGGLAAGVILTFLLFGLEADRDAKRMHKLAGAALALMIVWAFMAPRSDAKPYYMNPFMKKFLEIGPSDEAVMNQIADTERSVTAGKMQKNDYVRAVREKLIPSLQGMEKEYLALEPGNMGEARLAGLVVKVHRLMREMLEAQLEDIEVGKGDASAKTLDLQKELLATNTETGDQLRHLMRGDLTEDEKVAYTPSPESKGPVNTTPPVTVSPVAPAPAVTPPPVVAVAPPAPVVKPEVTKTEAPAKPVETAAKQEPVKPVVTVTQTQTATHTESRSVTSEPAKLPDTYVKPMQLGGSPASNCRMCVSRYPSLSPSMLQVCRDANQYSVQAIDVYTRIYTGYMPQDLLEALIKVKTQEQADCAVQIANKYKGSMPSDYLIKTCL